MSHSSAIHVTRSARITEAALTRPLLVVEHLDHTVGPTVQFTLCAVPLPANLTPTAPYLAETVAPVAVEGDTEAWV